MKRLIFFTIAILFVSSMGCSKMQDRFLDKDPFDVLTNDQVWENSDLINSVLYDLYDRIPTLTSFDHINSFGNFDEGFLSQNNQYGKYRLQNWSFNSWNLWNYDYIREINLFMDNIENSKSLEEGEKRLFLANGRFLRANAYFELVKRMGGVPLVLDTLEYNYDGKVKHLQFAREPESSVYDFIISELDAIKGDLPDDPSEKSLATWGAALAMESRAALYAGSIAKYGVNTPSVTLSDNIVGIPANKADHYYDLALRSAVKLINSEEYALYLKYPNDLEKNFAQLFLDKSDNKEVIFAKDYLEKFKSNQFTPNNQPHSLALAGENVGVLNPSLNLAQMYEKTDNTIAPFETKDASGDFIIYDKVKDIFKGRDARLGGTIMLPGSTFRGDSIDIFAGYIMPQDNWSILTGSSFGQHRKLPNGKSTEIVGKDGPINGLQFGTQTGFYVRKYLNPDPLAGNRTRGSDTWWIYYRYAEVLLNASEAAFELGKKDTAALYINEVRKRAGLKIPLKVNEITFNRIVHERRVEFAFEGHEFFDLKRWRLAHRVWNGQKTATLTIHPGDADAVSSRIFGLYPYKIYDPGHSDNGKWIFKEVLPSPMNGVFNFRLGNYYSRIPNDVMANNPKLIQNPNQ